MSALDDPSKPEERSRRVAIGGKPNTAPTSADADGELGELLSRLRGDDDSVFGSLETIRRRPGTAVILFANVVPALVALYFEWDPFAIVLLYWLENAVIGLFNLLRIACAAPYFRTKADELVGMFETGLFRFPQLTREFLIEARQQPAERMSAVKLFASLLFLLTFPVFLGIHLLVLFRIFEGTGPTGLLSALSAQLSIGFVFALAGLSIEHAWSFADDYVRQGGYRRTIPILQVAQPYPRLVAIHLALLIGALLAGLLPAPAVTAIVLVALKTVLDLTLVLRFRVDPEKILQSTSDQRSDSAKRSTSRRRASTARVTRRSDPIEINLPAEGVRAASRRFSTSNSQGLLTTAVGFTVIGAILFAMFVGVPTYLFLFESRTLSSGWVVFVLPVIGVLLGGVFLAVGVHCLIDAVSLGRLRAEIRVTGDRLEIDQRSLLTRRWSCRPSDVESIQARDSGSSVNNIPFWLLEVCVRGEAPQEFLYGRPKEEIQETAATLRAALGVEEAADD